MRGLVSATSAATTARGVRRLADCGLASSAAVTFAVIGSAAGKRSPVLAVLAF